MNKTLFGRMRYWALLVLIVLLAMSSHPIVMSNSRNAGMEQGTLLSPYIIIIFVGLVVICARWMLRFRVQKRSFIFLLFVAISALMAIAFFNNSSMIGDIRSIGISLCAIGVGCSLDLNTRGLKILLLIYAGLFIFVGLSIIMVGLGSFMIQQQYIDSNKNILGVNLATTILILAFFIMDKSVKLFWKMGLLVMIVFSFLIILTLRARTATLCAALILIYTLYTYFKGKNRNRAMPKTLGVVVFLLALVLLIAPVRDYIFNSFTLGYENENDILTGRTERNIAALKVVLEHPFLGNIDNKEMLAWVHNYPLLMWSNYGLIFAFPILFLYLYLLFFIIKRSLQIRNETLWDLGYIALLIPFICSMAEPTLPYGPGTGTVFNFILFGISLRKSTEFIEIEK